MRAGGSRVEDERVRVFVALELPDVALRSLIEWRDRALRTTPGARPLPAEAIHVTLCFLGWRSAREIPAIRDACGVLGAQGSPELALGEPVWLPPRRPRVLAVELDDHAGRLVQAQGALSEVLAAGGWYEPERRPYLPHVTTARLKAAPASRGRLPDSPRLSFRASRAVLYRSRLYRGGARYEALDTFRLSTA